MRNGFPGHHLANPRTRTIWLAFIAATTTFTIVHADPPPGYYDSADPSNAAALRASLHAIIDDHTRFPYTSTATDTWNVLESADEDPNNANNILDVYKNASYQKVGGGNTFYQREHTWPSSYGFPNDNSQNYPYTDCHHLRLCDGSYNGSRSNKPYRYCSAACTEQPTDFNNGQGGGTGIYPGNSNWTGGAFTLGTWETWIGRRGDVARGLFYMDVRYEGGTHGITGAAEPDLILTDSEALIDAGNTGSNESVAYMGMLSALLQWHQQDPVDDDERARNDAVFSFQGNRNPFVDHPEWVACTFSGTCGCSTPADCDDGLFCNGAENCVANACQPGSDPCPGQTCDEGTDTCDSGGPSGDPWINEFHYDNDGTDTGEFAEITGPAGLSLSGWQLIGYNGSGGATYNTIALSGSIPNQQGCMGTLSFAFPSMQNGSPDGLALVDNVGALVEFISYEGAFVATDGPANGMTSTDIGVSEVGTTPVGFSLRRTGTGSAASQFTWQPPAAATPGSPNTGQTLDGCGGCTTNEQCDDGVYCNGAETCVAGACQGGSPVNCSDGIACTVDSCNESTDSCNHTPNDAACDDGLFCNGDELCNVSTGCVAGTPANCSDGVACTGDSCNESTDSCDHVANNALCNDGLFCNGAETCSPTLGCQAGTNPCGGNPCDEPTDTCLAPTTPWINELHYDNDGTDRNEGVEVAGPAGTNLAGWQLVAYNGSGGASYSTLVLSGTLSNQQSGFGTKWFAIAGLQNGAPDGIALVNPANAVVQFLSYEGAFTATNGAAAGLTSVDIGVSESESTPRNYALQLTGTGSQYADFTWSPPAPHSRGQVNSGQTFAP